MSLLRGIVIVGIGALGVLLPVVSKAQPTLFWTIAMGFGSDGYAVGWETNCGYPGSPGNRLSIVGRLDRFCAPFDDLDPGDPEYTFYLSGLIFQRVETDGRWAYTGGTLRIYEGSPPNTPINYSSVPPNPPNASVPGTFTDGTVILQGEVGGFTFDPWNAKFETGANITGGTRYDDVAPYYVIKMLGRMYDTTLSGGYCWLLSGEFFLLQYPTVSVSPPCGVRGTVFAQPGRYFSTGGFADLIFLLPDRTWDLPSVAERTDGCGSFTHFYDSSPKNIYGTYSYYAVDRARPSIVSNVVRFKIMPPNRPNPPTSVQIENLGTGTTLKLSWNPGPSPFVEQYRVYRWQTGSPATQIGTTTTTSFEDQGLTRGQEYYYAVSAADCVGEGLLSGAVTGTPQYFPLVLVHGLCSNASTWSTFAQVLRDEGFVVHDGLNLTESNDRPQELVQDFADYLSTIRAPKVNVVAHSLGGLVTREYIVKIFEDPELRGTQRIKNLITLGTPHHGSEAYGYMDKHPVVRGLLRIKPEGRCLADAPASNDLVPGSSFLNGLNYGSSPGDARYKDGGRSWHQHNEENLRDPSVKHYTIAGTFPMCDPVEPFISGAWIEDGVYYFNDGVVAAASARLYNTTATNWLDTQLGVGALNHTAGPGIAYWCGQGLLESIELARVVANILRGNVPAQFEPTPALTLAAQTITVQRADSLVDLDSPAGMLLGGQVIEFPFGLPATSRLHVFLGSTDARLGLSSPTDPSITPDDTLTTPGLRYVHDGTLGLEGYLFENPSAGSWTLRADGTGSAQAQEFATAISFVSTSIPSLNFNPVYLLAGDSTLVTASIENSGSPIPGTSWTCSVTRPDSTTFNVILFDDGNHGDGLSGDGVSGAYLVPTGTNGFYHLVAAGTLPGGGPTLVTGAALELATFQDLAMDSIMTFSQGLINAGDSVQVFARVRNLGADPVSNVVVEFWDNAIQFGSATVSIAGNSAQTVQAPWIAAPPDTHRIRVTVSPFSFPVEASYTNNTAIKQVVLGQPIVGVEQPNLGGKLWLAPPQPNPSNGTVTFRFGLPQEGPVTITLYDLAGRRVKRWGWNSLPAGSHAVIWDGRLEHGGASSSGVYFLKFTAGSISMTRKIVRLN